MIAALALARWRLVPEFALCFAALTISALIAAADASHAADPASASATYRFTPPEVGSYALPAIQRVSEHRLLSSSGEPAPLLDLGEGEAALVSFVYLSCSEACPLATATLHRIDAKLAAHPRLGGKVQLVTVSFDPARDTPEALAALRKSLRPKGRWRFLTADSSAAIAPVLRDFGQDAVWVPTGEGHAPARLRHVLKLFLVDATGAVRNIYSTGFLDVRILLNDLETVLTEAG